MKNSTGTNAKDTASSRVVTRAGSCVKPNRKYINSPDVTPKRGKGKGKGKKGSKLMTINNAPESNCTSESNVPKPKGNENGDNEIHENDHEYISGRETTATGRGMGKSMIKWSNSMEKEPERSTGSTPDSGYHTSSLRDSVDSCYFTEKEPPALFPSLMDLEKELYGGVPVAVTHLDKQVDQEAVANSLAYFDLELLEK